MVEKRVKHVVESHAVELFHFIVPSCEIQPCLVRTRLLVKDVCLLHAEPVSFPDPGEFLKEDGGPCSLLFIPLVPVFQDDMLAPAQYRRQGYSVLHLLRLPSADAVPFFLVPCLLLLLAMRLDGLIFRVKNLPAVTYSQLVNGLDHELLHMEAVIDQPCCRKGLPDCQHHGR